MFDYYIEPAKSSLPYSRTGSTPCELDLSDSMIQGLMTRKLNRIGHFFGDFSVQHNSDAFADRSDE